MSRLTLSQAQAIVAENTPAVLASGTVVDTGLPDAAKDPPPLSDHRRAHQIRRRTIHDW